jgi:hypothetical protein
MPDLRGTPLRQALATLAALRTDVEIQGSGLVVQQSPLAGAPVASDVPVRLTLVRPAVAGSRAAPADTTRAPELRHVRAGAATPFEPAGSRASPDRSAAE